MSETVEVVEPMASPLKELAALEWSRDPDFTGGPLMFRGVLCGRRRCIVAGSADEDGARRLMHLAVDMAFGRA